MTAVISLLVIVTLSLLITRIATVALTLTGLAREAARFQARSAFTGVTAITLDRRRAKAPSILTILLFCTAAYRNWRN